MNKKAIILGASGLIGSQLLQLLLESPHYEEVLAIVRKPLKITHKKLNVITSDFSDSTSLENLIKGDVIFSCVGSTKKKTPNKADYLKVDKEIPTQIAKFGKTNGVLQFHIVSSLGADSNSSIFYSKMKGETEDIIKNIGIKSTHIYQPSLLIGPRKEKRFGEDIAAFIANIIDPLLLGSFAKYRSIKTIEVATGMYNQSLKNLTGTFTYPSDYIKKL
jgi:uncharacterized protein YbjT (DUF2867 family)